MARQWDRTGAKPYFCRAANSAGRPKQRRVNHKPLSIACPRWPDQYVLTIWC
jgi:hypothetical protein